MPCPQRGSRRVTDRFMPLMEGGSDGNERHYAQGRLDPVPAIEYLDISYFR